MVMMMMMDKIGEIEGVLHVEDRFYIEDRKSKRCGWPRYHLNEEKKDECLIILPPKGIDGETSTPTHRPRR